MIAELPTSPTRAATLAAAVRPLTRFLAGAVGGFAVVVVPLTAAFLLSAGPARPLGLGTLAVHALGWLAAMSAGYAAALRVTVPALRPDADVSGRRSVVAGAAAAGALLVACMVLGAVAEWVRLAAAALSGAGVGALMFWPWRRSRADRAAPGAA